MNALEDRAIDPTSFAFRDLTATDGWQSFTPTFGSITSVGDPTYTGRYRIVGAQFQFQVRIEPDTSIASTAGTDYLTLPKKAKGLGGVAMMSDDTSKEAVGLCHIDVANSKCYMPAQTASGDTFLICGWYEV